VVAYRQGQKWAEDRVKTTGAPARVVLSVDRPAIQADGSDLTFITAMITDGDGAVVPRSHNLVEFEILGPGAIVAVGNGDAASHEPFQASKRRAFNGLCQAIVKGVSGQPGSIAIKARSARLKDAELSITSR